MSDFGRSRKKNGGGRWIVVEATCVPNKTETRLDAVAYSYATKANAKKRLIKLVQGAIEEYYDGLGDEEIVRDAIKETVDGMTTFEDGVTCLSFFREDRELQWKMYEE